MKHQLNDLRLMRDGLDKDDIYVMVEDEFLSTAKTFTRHLHHAEYRRLKAVARLRNASVSNGLSRPVDGTTMMSLELRKRKERETILGKQRAILKSGNNAGSDREMEDSRDEDLWKGTNLSSLMSPSKWQNKALLGLDGLSSSTRAAAGYSPPRTKRAEVRVYDIRSTTKRERLAIPLAKPATEEGSATESGTDDDLDAPALTWATTKFKSAISSNEISRIDVPSQLRSTESHSIATAQNRSSCYLPTGTAKIPNHDKIEDNFSKVRPLLNVRARRAVSTLIESTKKDVKEIPTFLV